MRGLTNHLGALRPKLKFTSCYVKKKKKQTNKQTNKHQHGTNFY